MENKMDEQIFEAEGALEPDHPAIKHYFLSDLGSLYALTLSVLGVVVPFVFYSSDSGDRNPIIVVVFYIYLYLGSFCALAYMHTNVRHHRKREEDKFIAKLEAKQHELRRETSLSNNDLIIESCKEMHTDEQNDHEDFSHGEEGVHFLTRVGAIGFAMASFIMDGLDLVSYAWERSVSFECYGAGFIAVAICRILFVYSIASFIFKYHKILIHKHMALWKFLIGHLLAASLTLWSTTVIIEAMESFAHTLHSAHHEDSGHADEYNTTDSDYGHNGNNGHSLLNSTIRQTIIDALNATTIAILNSTSHMAAALQDQGHGEDRAPSMHETKEKISLTSAECLTQETIGVQAAPYLFPFVIEFALIAAATMNHLYRHIQRKEETKSSAHRDILVDLSRGYECHKSTIGLFFGILVFAVTIVFVALYVVIAETNSVQEYVVHLARQYFGIFTSLNIVGIFAVLVCLYKMRSHGFSDHLESPLDQNLLLLSLGGYYFMVSLQAIAAGVTLANGEEGYRFYSNIHIVGAILSFVQMTMQTVFIILGFRMRSRSLTHVIRKPGRAALTFLLVLNMAMWICNTFMQKMLTQSAIMSDFYGPLAWVILFNIFLPLTIFYRFHSAICLAEIWIEAYKLEEEEEHEHHNEVLHNQAEKNRQCTTRL